MHELSLALEVCRMAEVRVGRPALPKVRAVGLDVGDDAGIAVENLTFCLEALLAAPPFGHAWPDVTRSAGDDLRLTYLEVDDGRPDD